MADDHADGALDAADDSDFDLANDQAAGVDAVADVAVDRNDADVTISLLIIINNIIHSVINTWSSTSHKRKQGTQLQTQNSTHKSTQIKTQI